MNLTVSSEFVQIASSHPLCDCHRCWASMSLVSHHEVLRSWRRHQMETFSALLALCAGNSPVNSPHKGQWRGALMFSLICASINGWGNNDEAGDLRRRCAHYDVIVMRCCVQCSRPWPPTSTGSMARWSVFTSHRKRPHNIMATFLATVIPRNL